MEYQVGRSDAITDAVIAGYEVIRYGVPMIGEWDNEGMTPSRQTVTIRPAVPGAQYRITAWALIGSYGGRRSATPAVVNATTGKTCKSVLHIE